MADVVFFQDSHTDVVNHVRFHPDGKLLSGAEARQGLEEFPAGVCTRRCCSCRDQIFQAFL